MYERGGRLKFKIYTLFHDDGSWTFAFGQVKFGAVDGHGRGHCSAFLNSVGEVGELVLFSYLSAFLSSDVFLFILLTLFFSALSFPRYHFAIFIFPFHSPCLLSPFHLSPYFSHSL
jgi:hypothetical protein